MEPKLDWMYKGPEALINNEDYLLGKTIDRTFERLHDSKSSRNVDDSSRFKPVRKPVGSVQVDLERKLHEDPLLAIRKQEEESRRRILDNPIKLKQLRKMMEDKNNPKEKKMGGKSKGGSSDQELDEVDKKLKKYFKSHHLSKSSLLEVLKSNDHKSNEGSHKEVNASTNRNSDYRDKSGRYGKNPNHRLQHPNRSSPAQRRPGQIDPKERERKLKEMMENAKWRDDNRKKSVMKYREREEKELAESVSRNDPDFIRKHLIKAAASGSVEGRIKSNIYNIQRSHNSMDSNFARR